MTDDEFIAKMQEVTVHDATPQVVLDLDVPPILPNYERAHPVYGQDVKESIYRFANESGAAVTRFHDGSISFNYLAFCGIEITNYTTIAKAYFDSEDKVQRELRMLQSKASIEITKGQA